MSWVAFWWTVSPASVLLAARFIYNYSRFSLERGGYEVDAKGAWRKYKNEVTEKYNGRANGGYGGYEKVTTQVVAEKLSRAEVAAASFGMALVWPATVAVWLSWHFITGKPILTKGEREALRLKRTADAARAEHERLNQLKALEAETLGDVHDVVRSEVELRRKP